VDSFSFPSSDGTVLRGWRGTGSGPAVLICNGLGTIPEAWPALITPDCGYGAVTWYQRGTFGSERPKDPNRIRIEDHVEDAVALLDHEGVERALLVSWSLGVNVAFELARLHPDRVDGILAVAGMPGGTFATMGGPLRVPRRLRRPLAVNAARTGRLVGPVLSRLAPKVPVNPTTAWLIAHSGFMLPAARPEVVVPMLKQFLLHDWHWYGELAVAAAEHEAMDLSFLTCPVTFVAGQHDLLTGMLDMIKTAAGIPSAELTVLPGSHFLPMEYPGLIHLALDELARRAGL